MSRLIIRCLLSGEETDGAIAVFEEPVPPGHGPPLHRHPAQIEVFHVMHGQFQFRLEDALIERGPGAVVCIPKGAAHAFKNIGDEEGLLHFEMIPALKSEECFSRLANETIDDMKSFSTSYGIDILGPPL